MAAESTRLQDPMGDPAREHPIRAPDPYRNLDLPFGAYPVNGSVSQLSYKTRMSCIYLALHYNVNKVIVAHKIDPVHVHFHWSKKKSDSHICNGNSLQIIHSLNTV